MSDIDTGTLAEVPEDEQVDVDGHPDDYALDGGTDDDLADVYASPGEVVDEELG